MDATHISAIATTEKQLQPASGNSKVGALSSAFSLFRNRQAALPIKPLDSDYPQPLSYAQELLWLFQQINPQSTVYNRLLVFQIRGVLQIGALESAFNEIVRRHTILRTIYYLEGEHPVQRVLPHQAEVLPVIDLRDTSATADPDRYLPYLQAQMAQPYDLSREKSCRIQLLKMADDEHVLLYCVHHMCHDVSSERVLFHELSVLYRAFSLGEPSPLPELVIQYYEYAAAQRQSLKAERLLEKIKFHQQLLGNELPAIDLPCDLHHGSGEETQGKMHIVPLDPALGQALRRLGQQEGVSLFSIMLSAFYVLLYRYTHQEKLVVGTPVTNRNQADLQKLLGIFVNQVALSVKLAAPSTFRNLLQQVQEYVAEALTHPDVPFHKLFQHLQATQNDASISNQNPDGFQVIFNMPGKRNELCLHDLTVERLAFNEIDTQADFSLLVYQSSRGTELQFIYRTQLFSEQRIAQMATHYVSLLKSIVADCSQPIAQLPLLTEAEYQQIVYEWNDTAVDFGPLQTIHALFEQQVERMPDAVALVYQEQQLTYGQLNERANRLAHYLRQAGVCPETPVGVCLNRSFDLIIATLAIIKAGGAYVPLDANYPLPRLQFMVHDTGMPLILTETALMDRLPDSAQLVDLNQLTLESYPSDNLDIQITAAHLLYIMYTSGSTGQPKGIEILHHNVQRLIKGANFAQLDATQTFLQLASPSFDAATFEIWGSLCNGAKLILYPESQVDLALLAKLVAKQKTSILFLTTALFHQIVEHNLQALRGVRQLLVGGEVTSPQHVRRAIKELGPQTVYIACYGPTENTTFTTTIPLTDPTSVAYTVPIGRPISNSQVYLLDDALQPTPVGARGELYTGGLGVARGYLNRPELTAERFITHPQFGRLYKTGDLCRWLPDGAIEFLGRTDFQVKIRGFRIELGEIERALLAQEGVREAVVLAREEHGDRRLVAYVAPDKLTDRPDKESTDADIKMIIPRGISDNLISSSSSGDKVSSDHLVFQSRLRRSLTQELPDYMIPSAFVFLDAMPLTPNGKVDRRLLPVPDYRDVQSTFVSPRNSLENELTGIWSHVLGNKQVGIYDDFFRLGGNSLSALQVITQIHQAFGVTLSLHSLFKTPTVAGVAQIIGATQAKPSRLACAVNGVVAAQSAVARPAAKPWIPLLPTQLPLIPPPTAVDRTYVNSGGQFLIHSPVDPSALEHACLDLAKRHEALRLRVTLHHGKLMQQVQPDAEVPFTTIDARGWSHEEITAQITAIRRRVFDLAHEPPIRVVLLTHAPDEHILVLLTHHIATDGWSMKIICEELPVLYAAHVSGHVPHSSLPKQLWSFTDMLRWQHSIPASTEGETIWRYWQQQLADVPKELTLPTDYPRPTAISHRGAALRFRFPDELTHQLQRLARQQNLPLSTIVQSTLHLLIHQLSGQDDIVIGLVVTNRTRPELVHVVGDLTDHMPVRSCWVAEMSLIDYLKRLHTTTQQALAHQNYPSALIIQGLQTNLNSILLNYLHTDWMGYQQADSLTTEKPNMLRLEPYEFPFTVTGHWAEDLIVTVKEAPNQIGGYVSYNPDLFTEMTIMQMIDRFQQLLEHVALNPKSSLSALCD